MVVRGLIFFFAFTGCILLETVAIAQSQGKLYFDKNWDNTRTKSEVVYVRKWKKLAKEKYLINDYFLDGTLQMKGVAKNYNSPLIKFGSYTYYHKNGNVKSVGKFQEDKKHGVWKHFYENGDIEEFGPYDEADKHGVWQGFYKDSIFKFQGKYLADDQEGDWVWKYKNGQIAEKSTYEENYNIDSREGFYSNGQPRFLIEFNYKGKRHGEYWRKHKDGSFNVKGQYADGKRTGNWTMLGTDGKTLLSGAFKRGKRVGNWKAYYPSGQQEFDINYEEGELAGVCRWYLASGQLSVEENHRTGFKTKTKTFTPSGKRGSELNKEVAPNIFGRKMAILLNNKFGTEIRKQSNDKYGIIVSLNGEDKVTSVKFFSTDIDSSFKDQISTYIESLSWESRRIMNEKRPTTEYFFLKKNKSGDLESFQYSFYSGYSKFKGFESFDQTFEKPDLEDEDDQEEIFTFVETMPKFNGGSGAMYHYLSTNIKFPTEAVDKRIQGIVYVTFAVSQFGEVRDVRILRGIGGGCDAEAIRVVENMPLWIPGFQRGRPVIVQYNLPIRFLLGK